jgi:uncharacterized protein YdiU (UPF0061 family)
MTIFYRGLSRIDAHTSPADAMALIEPAFYGEPADAARAAFASWLADWQARLREAGESHDERMARMNAANPWIIPRNWLAQNAIKAAEAGDLSVLERLMRAIREPYREQPEFADLAARRPDWARNEPGCSALSCSS